jgi:hypothetical protein
MRRAAGLVIALAAGCLPAGPQPAGRQIVRDRTLSAVQFVPSQTASEPARLVVFGPTRDSRVFKNDMADLYGVSPSVLAGPVGRLADLTLLLSDAEHPGPYDSSFAFARTDAQGRMVVQRQTSNSGDPAVWRVDPETAAREDMGSTLALLGDLSSLNGKQMLFSPSRSRIAVARPGSGWAVFERDGSSVEVQSAARGSAGFVGEDFFYTSDEDTNAVGDAFPSRAVRVVRPAGAPELVFFNARLHAGFSTPAGGHLVVANEQPARSADLETASLIDLAAHDVHRIPFSPSEDEWIGVSPDGDWLAWRGPADVQFYAWATGDLHKSAAYLSQPIWRPGHHELWYNASYFTLVVRPTSGADWVYARANPFWQPGATTWSLFTPSGSHWLMRDFCTSAAAVCASGDGSWSDEAIYVGSSDQPQAPPTQIAAKGVALYRAWELDDGRILIEGYAQDAVRSDLYLFDPRTLATTVFPLKGFVVATGGSRALVFASWELGRWAGRLVLLDLTTGTQTQLAESAYAARVDPGSFSSVPPADRLAPGTRVAYLLRHQIDSPWDGLWVAELP